MTLLLLTLVFCVLPLAGIVLDIVETMRATVHHAVADCFAAPTRDALTRSIA